MQANVLNLLSWVSSEMLGASEPVTLLLLGGLLLVVGFRGRVRRSRSRQMPQPVAATTLPNAASVLAIHEAR